MHLLRLPEKQDYSSKELIAVLSLFALTNIVALAQGSRQPQAEASLVQEVLNQVNKKPGQLNNLAGLLDKNQAAMQLLSLLNKKEEQPIEGKKENKRAAAGE